MELTREDLLGHLAEQRYFLGASAAAFDAGAIPEAKRLAAVVRTLVVDSPASLLTQLEVLDRLLFADSGRDVPDNATVAVSLASMGFADGGLVYSARCGEVADRRPFDQWWTRTVLASPQIGRFSRERLVRSLANKDGGSHVDPTLPPDYASLSRANGIGWEVHTADGLGPVPGDPVPACMRQIAHEVMLTLDEQLPSLLS